MNLKRVGNLIEEWYFGKWWLPTVLCVCLFAIILVIPKQQSAILIYASNVIALLALASFAGVIIVIGINMYRRKYSLALANLALFAAIFVSLKYGLPYVLG